MLWKNEKGNKKENDFYSISPNPLTHSIFSIEQKNNKSFNNFKTFISNVKASLLSAFQNKKIYKNGLLLILLSLLSLLANSQNLDSLLYKIDTNISKQELNRVRVTKNSFVINKDTFAIFYKIMPITKGTPMIPDFCISNSFNYLNLIIRSDYTCCFENLISPKNPNGKMEFITLHFIDAVWGEDKKIKLQCSPTLQNISKLIYVLQSHQGSKWGIIHAINPEKVLRLEQLVSKKT
jgi:hypothetical protein